MIANAVSRVENLEFLTDVVPKTTTYRQHKQKTRQAPQQEDEDGTEPTPAANIDSPEVVIPAQSRGQAQLLPDGTLARPVVRPPPPVYLTSHRASPQREAQPSGEMEAQEEDMQARSSGEWTHSSQEGVEGQATNGARNDRMGVDDVMDVDGEEEGSGSWHSAQDERRDEGMDVEGC